VNARGLFVRIDGPGGTGKTTVAALVRDQLIVRGWLVHMTAEPSPTPLRQLIRASTDTYHGMALACLVAGDRHHHLAAEIRPHVESGAIVLSDRYLPASLVLQRMDGLDWETIWKLNTPVEVPDLAVILNAEPEILASRLAGRGAHSRFERLATGPVTESGLYHDAAARLASVGWPVCAIDTTASTPDEVAAIVTDRILTLPADRSADGS
jgi:dTMP kinase